MDAIYLLIPITVILLIVAVAIFFWAVNSDQYSDLDKEAHRILFDKESAESCEKQSEAKLKEREGVNQNTGRKTTKSKTSESQNNDR
jgi:cbb3-type cytochrome oxidase maturation protein